jgi:hypothetical protein
MPLDYLAPSYRPVSAGPSYALTATATGPPRPESAETLACRRVLDPRAARRQLDFVFAATPVWSPAGSSRRAIQRADRASRYGQRVREAQQRAARIQELELALQGAREPSGSLLQGTYGRQSASLVCRPEPEPEPEPTHRGPPDDAPRRFQPAEQRADVEGLLQTLQVCWRDFEACEQCILAVDATCTLGGPGAARRVSEQGGARAMVKAMRLHCDAAGLERTEAEIDRFRRQVKGVLFRCSTSQSNRAGHGSDRFMGAARKPRWPALPMSPRQSARTLQSYLNFIGRWRWERAADSAAAELDRRLGIAECGKEMEGALAWYRGLGGCCPTPIQDWNSCYRYCVEPHVLDCLAQHTHPVPGLANEQVQAQAQERVDGRLGLEQQANETFRQRVRCTAHSALPRFGDEMQSRMYRV